MEEPERSQAIENCKNNIPYTGDCIKESLKEAIYGSFDWDTTKEGLLYWMTIKNKYAYGTGS